MLFLHFFIPMSIVTLQTTMTCQERFTDSLTPHQKSWKPI